MNTLQAILKGLSGLLIANIWKDILPFVKDEADVLIASGKELFKIFTDSELMPDEKKRIYGLWRGQLGIFEESVKRQGRDLANDLLGILMESAFDEAASFLGFGND